MKPIFVTRLEAIIEHHSTLSHYQFLCDSNISTTDKWRNRINRLKAHSIQIIYLSLFLPIIKNRFPQITTWSDEDQPKFISAVYNRGFHCPYAEIKRYEQTKSFPARTLGTTFSYTKVSLHYYQDL